MTTTTNKALAEADARLAAAEKRFKQAKVARAQILQREKNAKDARRTRTNVLVGVAIQHKLKNAKNTEERRKLQAYIRTLVDECFQGGKESDYKAVVEGLDEQAADYPPLEDDAKREGEGTAPATTGTDDPRNL